MIILSQLYYRLIESTVELFPTPHCPGRSRCIGCKVTRIRVNWHYRQIFTLSFGLIRGVSKSSWNHPEIKEQESYFWYVVQKTSLHSHCAKLQISPTIYWLSTNRYYTIRCKSAILSLIKMYHICESALNDRLCLAVMSMVRFCLWIVFSL